MKFAGREFIPCTDKERKEWLAAYPRKLHGDIDVTCDPPRRTWNDFTLGKWPHSVVAICYLSSSWYGEDYPDDHYILPIASGEGATAPT